MLRLDLGSSRLPRRRDCWLAALLVGLVLGPAAPARAAVKLEARLLVFELGFPAELEAQTQALYAELLAAELAKQSRLEVVGQRDLDAMVRAHYEREKAFNCTGDDCGMELGRLVSARFVLFGSASPLGDGLVLTISVIDVATDKVVARAARALGTSLPAVRGNLASLAAEVGAPLAALQQADAVRAESAWRRAGLWTLGAGAAAALVGGLAGYQARECASRVVSYPDGTRTGQADAAKAHTFSLLANGLWIAGGALLAGGAVLVVVGTPARAEASPGDGPKVGVTLALGGRF